MVNQIKCNELLLKYSETFTLQLHNTHDCVIHKDKPSCKLAEERLKIVGNIDSNLRSLGCIGAE